MSASKRKGLLDSDVARYAEEGLIIPKLRVPGDLHDRMRAAVDRLLQDNPEVAPEYLVGPHIRKVGKDPAIADAFLSFALDPFFLDLVEQVLGRNFALWSSGVFCKLPGVGREVPWHQDGKYWPIRPLATCSVWVAIDDSKVENGCMRYIPGSHKRELVEHVEDTRPLLVLNRVVDPAAFDASAARDVELNAGELSMHDVFLIHGSNANKSARRRAGYVMRYMPTTSVYDRTIDPGQSSSIGVSEFARRPIWLARGIDVSGRNDFALGHDRPYAGKPVDE
ncbi:MAG: phytanoyl-CoA dioxygenase family protein [Alphaproteobacteria bacterium]|nr:phytanoyl-CoA dioxygenase family protein [Alphaproteobacteria bacterium]